MTDIVSAIATPSPSSDKAALRRAALARRAAVAPERAIAAAERLADLGAAVPVEAGAVVAGYLPIRGEIDPRPLMAALAARGARLALPVVEADRETLVFRAWAFGEPLEPASFGLSVPAAGTEVLDPDLLLMPLAAFDGAGQRIGYGKGHYDRALDRLERARPRRKIGLAFACQRVDAVPAEPHDRRLDLILTEDGPIRPETDTGRSDPAATE